MASESGTSDAENPGKISPEIAGGGMRTLQESFLSPGIRSAAAMAGWDEEALLHASLVVEDTPVRESRRGKGPGRRLSRTPPTSTNSKRKRKSRRQSPATAISPVVLCLDDDDYSEQAATKAKNEPATEVVASVDGEKTEASLPEKALGEPLPCMDRLREELSCAICLEICFEPSTTPCGHSFCIKCLKCAAAKCGKRCPKCRELISNGRSCTVNTVLWNTIQLLFPKDVQGRKNAGNAMPCSSVTCKETTEEGSNTSTSGRTNNRHSIRGATRAFQRLERDRTFTRRDVPNQSEDAALALRLQREEFLVAFNSTGEQQRNALHAARVNLRAMPSRARHTRIRNPTI